MSERKSWSGESRPFVFIQGGLFLGTFFQVHLEKFMTVVDSVLNDFREVYISEKICGRDTEL